MKRSQLSRITVSRALRELQSAGLVERFAGSGTYVPKNDSSRMNACLFGLLIPELGKTEIFAPICSAIASAPDARSHAMLWGNLSPASTPTKQALALAEQFIARKVNGVFFAPLEFGEDAERVNRRILRQLKKAKIAAVLLDRRISRSFDRDRADLVGINHRQAAYVATEHLLRIGSRRLSFVEYAGSPSTIDERRTGFYQAVTLYGIAFDESQRFDIQNATSDLKRRIRSKRLDGLVCVNDHVAGQVMQLLMRWGVEVPGDVRIVGIDDVNYASMLPVPLTTVKQPIEQIGESALRLMLERIRMPNRPTREVLLDGTLVIRESTGGSSRPLLTTGGSERRG